MAKYRQSAEVAAVARESREFTCRSKGGHVVYLQKLQMEPANGKSQPRPLKRAITVRLVRGVKFDPFLECGPDGQNRSFRDISAEDAFLALKEKADDRESPICLWDDRPMTDEESAHSRELKAANKRADEQQDANAKLRALLEENGLKVPADI